MTTNRERINQVESELEEMQDKIQRMELGINDKLAHIEATLSKLTDSINTSKGSPSINIQANLPSIDNNTASSRPGRENSKGRRQHF